MYNKYDKLLKNILKKMCLLGLLTISPIGVWSQKTFSLDECVEIALTNNRQIKNSEYDIQITESNIKEVKSSFLPNINLVGQYQYYIDVPFQFVPSSMFGGPAGEYSEFSLLTKQSTQGSMQASQLLYNQKVFIGLKAAKAANDMSVLQLQNTKEELIYNVSAIYYNLQVLQQNINLLDSNVISLEKTVNVNKLLKDNYILNSSTYKRLVINLDNLKNEKVNLSLAYDKTSNLLKFLMGKPISDSLHIKPFEIFGFTELPIGGTIDNRTDIRIMNEQLKLVALDKKSAQAEYYPSLTATYNYGFTGYNDEFSLTQTINDKWLKSSYVGVQLSMPVFSGFSRHQKIKQKKISELKVQNSFELLKQTAQKELSDAVLSYSSRKNSLENMTRSLNLASELFRNASIEFSNGLITISDLIAAQNDLNGARNNLSNAMINLKLAELDLKKSSGSLLENK